MYKKMLLGIALFSFIFYALLNQIPLWRRSVASILTRLFTGFTRPFIRRYNPKWSSLSMLLIWAITAQM